MSRCLSGATLLATGTTEDGKMPDVVVKVSETKAADITTAIVDGKKCLCVPIEPDEVLMLNGEQI